MKRYICNYCGKEFIGKRDKRYNIYFCSKECHTNYDRDNYKERFKSKNKKFDLIQYVGKNEVIIACKNCGNRINTNSTNAMKKTYCIYCNKSNKLKRNLIINTLKYYDNQIALVDKLNESITKKYEKVVLKDKQKEETRRNRRAREKRHELTRKRTAELNGRVDNDIELSRLYKRDKGICYICGLKCDYKDFKYDDNNNFIVGKTYPSIDHYIPISKGGTHSWDNVRLACYWCNVNKRDKMPRGGCV